MAGEREGQVRVKLTLDDRASAGAERSAKAFKQVSGAVTGATGHIASFVRQTLAMTAGLSLDRAIQGIKTFGQEAINAASGAQQASRHIAALFIAAGSKDMERTTRVARGVNDELEQIGISAGISADSVVANFEDIFGIVNRTTGSIGDAVKLTRSLAVTSSALGIPMEATSQSVLGIAQGVARAKDPIVQLLKTFGGLDVTTKAFKKLTETERMMSLEFALKSVEDRLSGLPPGFTQLSQSFHDIKDNIKEAFGGPLIEAAGGALAKLNHWFTVHRVEVEDFAQAMGTKVAAAFESATRHAMSAFRWIRANWDEIVRTAKQLPRYAALAYGGSALGRAGLGAGGAILRAGGGVAGEAAKGILGRLGGGAARAAPAAAAAGSGVATHFVQIVFGGLKAAPSLAIGAAPAAGPGLMAALGGPQAVITIGLMAAAMIALVAAMAIVAGAVNAFSKNLSGLGTLFGAVWTRFESAIGDLWTAMGPLVDLFSEFAGTQVIMLVVALTSLARAFAWLLEPINQILALTGRTPRAPSSGGTGAEDPFVISQRRQQAEERRARADERARGDRLLTERETQRLSAAPVNDFRGSTFNIKQDFKDQDPDRVAVVFQDDIQRSAESRIQARTALPFGT